MKYQNVGGYIIGHLQYAVPEDTVSNVRDIDAFMDKLGEILSGYLPAGDDWKDAIESAIELSLPKEFTPQQLAEHDALATYLYDYEGKFNDVVERLMSGSDVGVEPHTCYRELKPEAIAQLLVSMYELLESRYTQLSEAWVDGCIPEQEKTPQRRKKPSLRAVPTDDKPSFSVELPIDGSASGLSG